MPVVEQEKYDQCGKITKHVQIPGTSSCWCGGWGYKYTLEKKELDLNNLPPCAWCSQPPSIDSIATQEVFCATEGCPAFSNVVTKERWCERGVHEMEVMWIPKEEPIFVLRAQDQLSLVPIYQWVDLAEKKKVPEEKTDLAMKRASEMDAYQRAVKSKLPD
jgi:hypothetical protein